MPHHSLTVTAFLSLIFRGTLSHQSGLKSSGSSIFGSSTQSSGFDAFGSRTRRGGKKSQSLSSSPFRALPPSILIS